MAFGIRCNFNRIQSYAEAVKAWQKGVVFSKHDTHPRFPRGLVDKRKKHLSIERTEADDIVLRLYNHPTVTWHKDHSVTICAHSTKSTGVFANHCTPNEMIVTSGDQFRVTVDGRTYRVPDHITFRPRDDTWKADKITPWLIPQVNRERAKQALRETGYEEFRLWFKVYVQMAEKPDGKTGWAGNNSIVIMLRNRRWRGLVTHHFPDAWHYPDRVLHKIRQAIYAECDCIEQKSVPFLG